MYTLIMFTVSSGIYRRTWVNNLGRMAYDPMYKLTYENVFEVVGRDLEEWKDFYPDS